MVKLSVLDLAYIGEGFSASDALANALDLAQHAETAGYTAFGSRSIITSQELRAQPHQSVSAMLPLAPNPFE